MNKEIIHKWVHSHEEDTDDFIVFRKSDYSFPPSRGRRKIEFKEDGKFVQSRIGSSCGSEERVGRFEEVSPNELKVYFDDDEKRNRTYSIKLVSYNNKVLKVKKESFY